MDFKYKVGDRVRVRSDLKGRSYYMGTDKDGGTVRDSAVGSMLDYAGKIVTIRCQLSSGKYEIEGDHHNWTDGMFDGIVIEDKPAKKRELKAGDKVIVRADLKENGRFDGVRVNEEMARKAGKTVVIRTASDKNRYYIEGCGWLWTSEMFILDGSGEVDSHEQSITITSDGKKTTATYRNNGKTVVAFSRCGPNDTFDFAEGAKIAFARLWDGEEEDEPEQQGYNGKIVCIQRGYNNISDPLIGLTVGKVYTVTDGRLTFDDGHTSACKYFTLEALCIGTGHKFIPLVE